MTSGPSGQINDARLAVLAGSHIDEILKLKHNGELASEDLETLSALRAEAREKVLEEVRVGTRSRENAETWARERGEIFEHRPDPTRFDPMSEEYWTLPMALAWIIWRSDEEVRQAWHNYRWECVVWSPNETVEDIQGKITREEYLNRRRQGWELRRLPPVSRSGVLRYAMNQGASEHLKPPLDAAKELDRGLQSGRLPAKGRLRPSDTDALIPIERWPGFPYLNDDDARPDAVSSTKGGTAQFCEVLVPRRALMREWKSTEPESPSEPLPEINENPLAPADRAAIDEAVRARLTRFVSGELKMPGGRQLIKDVISDLEYESRKGRPGVVGKRIQSLLEKTEFRGLKRGVGRPLKTKKCD